jgi:hypothetical protein
MKKWLAAIAMALVAGTSIAWSYADRSNVESTCCAPVDPLATPECHRHLGAYPTHWASMVLVME